MRFIEKIQESNLRFLLILFAFICLILNVISFENNLFSRRMTTDDCLWIVVDTVDSAATLKITQIIPGGVADQAGLKDGDLLIAINGRMFTTTESAMDILNKYSNQFVTYTIVRNGIMMDIDIWVYKFVSISFLIFWVVGLAFLFVGTIVGYSRPKELTSRLFFFFSCAASIGLILYSGINPAGSVRIDNAGSFTSFLYMLMNRIYALAMVLIPPLYIHFFITYPIKYNFKRRKLFLWVLYILVLIPLTSVFIVKSQQYQGIISTYLVRVIPVLYFIAGTIFFRRSYRKITDPGLKKSLSIISKGFLLGGIGITYSLVFSMINKDPYFLVNPLYLIPNALILAIPISFGFSIIKYRILDTESIVKKSLVFGIVTLLIITVYLVLVYLMNSYFKELFKNNNQLLIITFIIIFTFSFDFVNRHAKDFIDRQFYRERYNYRKALLNFTKDTSYINNIEDLVISIRDFLRDTVGISSFILRVFNSKYIRALDLSPDKNIDVILRKIIGGSTEPVIVNALKISEMSLTGEEEKLLKEKNIKLLIPIYLKGELLGAINFGEKKSGKAFSDEDIDLLKSFASQSAICLENSRLQKEQADKLKYEEEVNIAARIQNSLLPKTCEIHPHLEICGFYRPAENIGGDFYDIIRLSDNKILVAIADVSDKGIPAALYMSQVQAMIQFAANIFESPRDILVEINKQIFDQMDKYSFVTVLIAVFDLDTNKIRVARAGHSPMLLIRDKKSDRIYSKGIGIGLEKNGLFSDNIDEVEIEIKENDLYFMYSDGLSEAMNSDKDLYTVERLEKKLTELSSSGTESIKNDILSDVDNFRNNAPVNDDITFVAIKVK